MTYRAELRNERGIALVVVLLVVLAIAAIAAGAALLGSNTSLITMFHGRQGVLEAAADASIEETRAMLNGSQKASYPTTGYSTLESGVAVYDAAGKVIPNVKRWTYVGPIGLKTGQYGVFGSVVVVAQDAQGDQVIRRGEVFQESFAKYAYFTDKEGAIVFGGGDQIFGPVFSNDKMTINSTGVTFWGPVATAQTITGTAYGVFKQGYKENATAIPFPKTADLNALQGYATQGNTAIVSTTKGTAGQATTRIEFVAVDLNGDGNSTGLDEGFMKVYQVNNTTTDAWWVVADTIGYGGGTGLSKSRNCGHVLAGTHAYFRTFYRHKAVAGTDQPTAGNALTNGTQLRCYLGGADILNDSLALGPPLSDVVVGKVGSPQHGVFLAADSLGKWLLWNAAPDPKVVTARALVGDAAYLWPINRTLNPNFKGVIYVTGKVAVSGVLRGQVTVAATDNIIVADDILYATNPAATTPPCGSSGRDMLGLFSGTNVVVADNMVNDPIPPMAAGGAPGTTPRTWDDTQDEFIQATVLALGSFTVENYASGSASAEPCGTTAWGRGCLYLTGGIIQAQRGAVGTVTGTGNLKRYAYDACASTSPPPYYPTTGIFSRGHYYEVDPTGFDIATYWNLLIGG
jgi:hypothetical protein